MKKVLKYLGLLIPLAVAVLSIYAIQIMAIGIYYNSYFTAGLFLRFVMGREDITLYRLLWKMPSPSLTAISNVALLSSAVWVVIFYPWYKRLSSREKVIRAKLFTIRNIILIFLISIGYQLAISGLMDMLLPLFDNLAQEYGNLMEQLESAHPVITFISVIILAPISEELIFRGVIFKNALKLTSFAVANILQALFFGLFHMNVVQGIYAFAGGLAMGYITYQYRTLRASILFHLFFNSISYILIAPINELMKILYIIVGSLITGFALHGIKKVGSENDLLASNMEIR